MLKTKPPHTAIAIFMLCLSQSVAANAQATKPPVKTIIPQINAHAHNDYEHRRPLLDALDHGFCNVEADVFLIGDQLLVAHNLIDVRPGRTLEALYLLPLQKRIKANGGQVYRDGPAFTLMIDFKSDGTKTYAVLEKLLAEYDAMLSSVRDGKLTPGAVSIVISGNRDKKAIAASKVRYVGIDGRLSDLDSKLPAHLMPWISDRWSSHFSWRGTGEMPEAERKKLREIVVRAHEKGRRVRFWATADREAMWRELHDAQVDLINTDDLAGLEKFLLSQKK